MDGKQVYRFGITKPIENINELLRKSNLTLKDIKYIVPHQSNLKIMKSIGNKLKIDNKKIFTNIFEILASINNSSKNCNCTNAHTPTKYVTITCINFILDKLFHVPSHIKKIIYVFINFLLYSLVLPL